MDEAEAQAMEQADFEKEQDAAAEHDYNEGLRAEAEAEGEALYEREQNELKEKIAILNGLVKSFPVDATAGTLIKMLEYARNETAKAYGGCKKCYGKGYSTVSFGHTKAEADFIGEKQRIIKSGGVKITFCSCSRGKQLEELMEEKNI